MTASSVCCDYVQPTVPPPYAPWKGAARLDKMRTGQPSPRRPPARIQQIDWLRHNREVVGETTLKGLDDSYVIENRRRVAAFIERNRLRAFLQQARKPLNDAFGEATVKTLTIVCDDEGFETLFCLVRFTGDMRQAKLALNSFDEHWWLMRSDQVAEKLNFDFELG
ncbi:MAG: hypothetical protein HYX72_04680 [Acidobacteria bacterium]|nr:hypothetical protein [Acidobacteriota bacterium]